MSRCQKLSRVYQCDLASGLASTVVARFVKKQWQRSVPALLALEDKVEEAPKQRAIYLRRLFREGSYYSLPLDLFQAWIDGGACLRITSVVLRNVH